MGLLLTEEEEQSLGQLDRNVPDGVQIPETVGNPQN